MSLSEAAGVRRALHRQIVPTASVARLVLSQLKTVEQMWSIAQCRRGPVNAHPATLSLKVL